MRLMHAILLLPLALKGQTGGDDAASISGSVTNALSGEPLRRALVYLRRIDATPSATNVQVSKTTYTDAAGRFTIEGITPGKYRLSAERSGFLTASYGQRSATGSGALMTIDAGQKMNDAAMRMSPHGVIAGRVLDEDGEPVVSANVQVMRQQYVQGKKQLSGAGGGSTNDLGEYRIFGLRPGRYYVTVTNRGNPMLPDGEDDYVTTFFPRTTDPSAAVPVDVTPGAQLRNIDVAMRKMRAVTVTGRVSNEIPASSGADGSQRMSVMLAPRAAGMGSVNTRGASVTPQGTFEIRSVTPGAIGLPPLSWVVEGRSPLSPRFRWVPRLLKGSRWRSGRVCRWPARSKWMATFRRTWSAYASRWLPMRWVACNSPLCPHRN
jgi:protocatechuate 3,4-dioxygenase beta subunit